MPNGTNSKSTFLNDSWCSGLPPHAGRLRKVVSGFSRSGVAMRASGQTHARRVSAKRPEMGILRMKFELLDLAGELKCEITGVQFMRVRNP